MISFYQDLRNRLPLGVPYDDAVQLFLWMYCATSILPLSMRHHILNKETLADAFERLEIDGVVLPPRTATQGGSGGKRRYVEWTQIVWEFLSNQIEWDLTSEEMARNYLRDRDDHTLPDGNFQDIK